MSTDTHPALPSDDSSVYEGRRIILNRIDQEWGCDAVVSESWIDGVKEYCGIPEWDPFTRKCWHHGPGPLGSL